MVTVRASSRTPRAEIGEHADVREHAEVSDDHG
jgi:hypothetical protein